MHERSGRHSAAHHDFAQSANVFDLLGERYQAALSHLALGRLAAQAGKRAAAERYLDQADAVFTTLGAAARPRRSRSVARALLDAHRRSRRIASQPDADEAVVRRLVDAAILPELLARETATALLETTEARCGGRLRRAAAAATSACWRAPGATATVARALARAASQGSRRSTATACC